MLVVVGVMMVVRVAVRVGMIMPVVMAVHVSMVMAMVMSTRLPGRMVMSTVMGGSRLGLFFDYRMRTRSEILDRLGREDIDIGQWPQPRSLQGFGCSIAFSGGTGKLHKGVSSLPGKTVGREQLGYAKQ
jgi:hypothetical protein